MKSVLKNYWLWIGGMLMASSNIFADEAAHAAGAMGGATLYGPIGVGLGMAIAVFGAAMAQGRIGASYMEGVARNPGAQKAMGTQLILSLVFVETLVLFTFAILWTVMGKVWA